jgi:GxxExxY protein
MTQYLLNELTYEINAAAIEVHKSLGPGLLESIYQKCLKQEFKIRGIPFQSELRIPLHYKGIDLESCLRCDFLVEELIVIETKSVEMLVPVYDAQLLSYMQQLQVPKGILYNFNCEHLLRKGQKTLVNKLFGQLPEREQTYLCFLSARLPNKIFAPLW